jgi:hypothetical protein
MVVICTLDYHWIAESAKIPVPQELDGSLAVPGIWRKRERIKNTLALRIKTCLNTWRLSRMKNKHWTPSWCHLPELKESGVEVLSGRKGRHRPGTPTDMRDLINPAVERGTEAGEKEGTLKDQNFRILKWWTSLIRKKKEVELVGLRTAVENR